MSVIYDAMKWLTRAWRMDVANETILKCFRKSIVIDFPVQGEATESTLPDLRPLFQAAAETTAQRNNNDIRSIMSIENFLNPEDEDAIEESDEINDIISELGFGMNAAGDDPSDQGLDDEVTPITKPIPTISQAIQGVQTVLEYAHHLEKGSFNGRGVSCIRLWPALGPPPWKRILVRHALNR